MVQDGFDKTFHCCRTGTLDQNDASLIPILLKILLEFLQSFETLRVVFWTSRVFPSFEVRLSKITSENQQFFAA